jgi:hypothetical protein
MSDFIEKPGTYDVRLGNISAFENNGYRGVIANNAADEKLVMFVVTAEMARDLQRFVGAGTVLRFESAGMTTLRAGEDPVGQTVAAFKVAPTDVTEQYATPKRDAVADAVKKISSMRRELAAAGDLLDALAEQNPFVASALSAMSGQEKTGARTLPSAGRKGKTYS